MLTTPVYYSLTKTIKTEEVELKPAYSLIKLNEIKIEEKYPKIQSFESPIALFDSEVDINNHKKFSEY